MLLSQVEIRRLTEYPTFLPSKTPGCFCCLLCVFVHLYYNASWIPVHFSIHPAASVFCSVSSSSSSSSLNRSNQRHWKSCTLMPSHWSMFLRWWCMLWIMSCSKPSPYFFLLIILVQVGINFSHPKKCFSRSALAFLDVFESGLVCSLWWSLCICSGESSLDCRLWQWHICLLESVLLLVDVVNGVFFTMQRILQSSITFVLCGRRSLFMLQSSPVWRSFFLECTKLLLWPLLMFLLSLWWICFVFEA